MKVKISFTTDLDKVLKTLSKQIETAQKNVIDLPRDLHMVSDLLRTDESAEVGFCAIKLIEKIRENLSETDLILNEINAALTGYMAHITAEPAEVVPAPPSGEV